MNMKHWIQRVIILFVAFFSCAMDIPIKKLKTVQEADDALRQVVELMNDVDVHRRCNGLGNATIRQLQKKMLNRKHTIPPEYLYILTEKGLIKEKIKTGCFKSKHTYVVCKYVTTDMIARNQDIHIVEEDDVGLVEKDQ